MEVLYKMKKAKKVFAIAASVAMIGVTAASAAALDLSDYPQPFISEDGELDAAIVVGANAATQDVLGSIDIAAALQSEAVTAVEIEGSSEVVVTGGEEFDDLFLGQTNLAFDTQLDANDLDGFVDSDFDQDDTDVDYKDYLEIQDGAIAFYGAGSAAPYNEDFGKTVYAVVTDETKIRYVVEIEDDFNSSNIGATGFDDDVEFKMLGTTIRITGASGTNEITIEGSNEYYLEEGDSIVVDGSEITLISADANEALIEVDGEVRAIDEDDNYEFDSGIEVQVESSFYRENSDTSFATIKVGESVSSTVQDGEAAETFGQGTDDDEAEWVWYINMSGEGSGNPSYIGLTYNQERTEIGNEVDEDDGELPALAVGDKISLPNNYAEIEFAALKYSDFTKVTVEIDDDIDLAEDTGGDTIDNAWGIKFSTDSGSEDFTVSGTKTEEVWVVYQGGDAAAVPEIWYKDGSDEYNNSNTTLSFNMRLDSENVEINVPYNNSAEANYSITFPGSGEVLMFNATHGNDYFGSGDEDDAADLHYNGNSIGTADYDGGYFVTNYGAWFENPEDMFNSGSSWEFSVPDERQEATVVVRTAGSFVSGGSAGGTSYQVNAAGLGLGILDTDAPALGSKPMIIVGGPAVNSVAAEVMGNPTTEELLETFSEGKAIIKYYDDSQALLVAGWGALETQGASNVVADYMSHDFEGDELEVVVTSLNDISVNPVN